MQGGKRMLSCYDVAQYFLSKADEDAGDLMSNLKLQKLVYYAQGIRDQVVLRLQEITLIDTLLYQ
jgi:uncharacterized phage-associated protein